MFHCIPFCVKGTKWSGLHISDRQQQDYSGFNNATEIPSIFKGIQISLLTRFKRQVTNEIQFEAAFPDFQNLPSCSKINTLHQYLFIFTKTEVYVMIKEQIAHIYAFSIKATLFSSFNGLILQKKTLDTCYSSLIFFPPVPTQCLTQSNLKIDKMLQPKNSQNTAIQKLAFHSCLPVYYPPSTARLQYP